MNNDVSHSRLTPLAFLERTALVFPDRTAGKVKKYELRERMRAALRKKAA